MPRYILPRPVRSTFSRLRSSFRFHSRVALCVVAVATVCEPRASADFDSTATVSQSSRAGCEVEGRIESQPERITVAIRRGESKVLPSALTLVTAGRGSTSLGEWLLLTDKARALYAISKGSELEQLRIVDALAAERPRCKWEEARSGDVGWGADDELLALSDDGETLCIRIRRFDGSEAVERIVAPTDRTEKRLVDVVRRSVTSAPFVLLARPNPEAAMTVFTLDAGLLRLFEPAEIFPIPGIRQVRAGKFQQVRGGIVYSGPRPGIIESRGLEYPPGTGWDSSPWAHLPKACTPSIRAVGDFDGNGSDDLLLQGDSLCGWWVVMSNGRTGIEIPIGAQLAEDDALHPIDWDGDGVDEIARYDSGTGRFEILQLGRGSGIPGVTVDVDGQRAVTDEHGRYHFNLDAGAIYKITPSAPGLSFSPSVHSVYCIGAPYADATLYAGFVGGPVERQSVFGMTEAKRGPSICIGYHEYGPSKWRSERDAECEPGFGVYSVDDSGYSRTPLKLTGVACCPLPAADILTEKTTIVERSCAEGQIITGYVNDAAGSKGLALRCTEIDGSRYELGPPEQGVYWGQGFSIKLGERQLPLSAIPEAIRAGVGRRDLSEWDVDGCIGEHPGALLTSIGNGDCESMVFRRLRYRSTGEGTATALDRGGQPGEEVRMFPDCTELHNRFDPRAGCDLRLPDAR